MKTRRSGSGSRAMDLLLQLLELPLEERESFLDSACAGDPSFRSEVESLRAQLDEARGHSTAEFRGAIARSADVPELPVRDLLVDFEILDRIGEGGMGVVYRARQLRPVEREVAVKVLGRHAGEQLLSRFEAEWKALGRMEHPNIAHLLDVREDSDGSPCFVMEFVRGRPLIEYCDENGLDLKTRITVLRDVCLGVQHAHEKGILHRDLKPDNVLVTNVDGRHLPKIIDFGIARALEGSLGTSRTATGQLLGTPEYMSPEQALGLFDRLDTRSDIYSLGVILYRCLTGQFPYDVQGGSVLDVIRTVAEEPARRPTQVTRDRKLDRDLELILLKALEKDPERRYHSAASLGGDLRRYLAGDPVLARPSSTLYQLRKLVARNRVPFALVASLFVLSIVSTVVVTILYQAQKREREAAIRNAAITNSANQFLVDVVTGAAGERSIDEMTVSEALLAAEDRILADPLEDPTTQAKILFEAAIAHQGLGERDVTRMLRVEATGYALLALEEATEEARTRTAPLRALLEDPMTSNLDDPPAALSLLRPAITEDHREELRLVGDAFSSLGQIEILDHRVYRASIFYREAKCILQETAPELIPQTVGYAEIFLHTDLDRFDEAEAIARKYLEQYPDLESQGHYGFALAKLLMIQERNEEALPIARLGPAGVPNDRGVNFALASRVLTLVLIRTGRFEEASVWLERTFEAAATRRKTGQAYIRVHELAVELALARGRLEDAAAAALEALEESAEPDLIGCLPLAQVRCAEGKFIEAEALWRRSIEHEPDEWRWRRTVRGHSRFGLGWALYGQERYEEAKTLLDEAIELWDTSHDTPPYWWLDLARLVKTACQVAQGVGTESGAFVESWHQQVLERGRAPFLQLADDARHQILEES